VLLVTLMIIIIGLSSYYYSTQTVSTTSIGPYDPSSDSSKLLGLPFINYKQRLKFNWTIGGSVDTTINIYSFIVNFQSYNTIYGVDDCLNTLLPYSNNGLTSQSTSAVIEFGTPNTLSWEVTYATGNFIFDTNDVICVNRSVINDLCVLLGYNETDISEQIKVTYDNPTFGEHVLTITCNDDTELVTVEYILLELLGYPTSVPDCLGLFLQTTSSNFTILLNSFCNEYLSNQPYTFLSVSIIHNDWRFIVAQVFAIAGTLYGIIVFILSKTLNKHKIKSTQAIELHTMSSLNVEG
jgi:hypothetical protein